MQNIPTFPLFNNAMPPSRAYRPKTTKIGPPATKKKTGAPSKKAPDNDDDDDWVSTESASGGATPIHESESESESEHSSERLDVRPRPPSSMSTRSLRVHPLIRGTSSSATITDIPTSASSRPHPLEPLTVTDFQVAFGSKLSESPESLISPISASASRRLSFSSQRSTTATTHYPNHNARTRTVSTSSSAALSSLAQFPSATRPPSPAALSASISSHPAYHHHHYNTHPHHPTLQHLHPSHLISFFPPTNPHANVEHIHPLLPHPYLGNHLSVLAKRTPMREALERVRLGRAKRERAP